MCASLSPLLLRNTYVLRSLELTRDEVYSWGRSNRVAFDASKEYMGVIHPLHAEGSSFKFLGCLFDTKLAMQEAIESLISRMKSKLRALLKSRGIFIQCDLIMQYKIHIWSLQEYHVAAMFHAPRGLLAKLDAVQSSFLRQIGMTEEVALLSHTFAPPCVRRQIGILGCMHKSNLGLCHDKMRMLFAEGEPSPHHHGRQIANYDACCTHRRGLFERSVFSFIRRYNVLPEHIVAHDSVETFQSALMQLVKFRCAAGLDWKNTFNNDIAPLQ